MKSTLDIIVIASLASLVHGQGYWGQQRPHLNTQGGVPNTVATQPGRSPVVSASLCQGHDFAMHVEIEGCTPERPTVHTPFMECTAVIKHTLKANRQFQRLMNYTTNPLEFIMRFPLVGRCPAPIMRKDFYLVTGKVVIDPIDRTKSYAVTTGCNLIVQWGSLQTDVRDTLLANGCRLAYDLKLQNPQLYQYTSRL
uniref:Shell matrix protein n=1 Tax=Laqueus rubellus TaxID=93892 RepID=A0A3G9CM06_LAQRU